MRVFCCEAGTEENVFRVSQTGVSSRSMTACKQLSVESKRKVSETSILRVTGYEHALRRTAMQYFGGGRSLTESRARALVKSLSSVIGHRAIGWQWHCTATTTQTTLTFKHSALLSWWKPASAYLSHWVPKNDSYDGPQCCGLLLFHQHAWYCSSSSSHLQTPHPQVRACSSSDISRSSSSCTT